MLFTTHTFLGLSSSIKRSCLLFILGLSIALGSSAQGDKRLLAEASKYFDYGDYFTAARLYEQYLNPNPALKSKKGLPVYNSLNQRGKSPKINLTKQDVIYKLATAYRLSFYFPQAAEQYKKCYDEKDNKYPDSYYWYAVCMRSVNNYGEARTSLTKFLSAHAAGSPLKAAAEAEEQTLNFIDQQMLRPDTILFVVKKADNIIGMEKGVYAAADAGDSKLIVTSTIRDSTAKKNTNPYRNRLFLANEGADHTIQDIEMVKIEDNDNSANQGTAVLHNNGALLYFTQWIKVKEKSTAGIYASKKKDGKWNKPEKLGYVNLEGFNSKQPALSPDGRTMYFASDRTGSLGAFDLWSVSLDSSGMPNADAINLGSVVNTSGDEQAPHYHPDQNVLVFSTNYRPGMGGYDLFLTKKTGDEWTNPENIGYPVNSTRDDIYYYNSSSELMKNAYLSSDRGSSCCLETYHISKLPKKRKLSGQLLLCEGSQPMADAEVELNTGSGNKVRTDADGKFTFELNESDKPVELVYSKDSFIAKTTQFKVVTTDEKDPLTNIFVQESVCLDRVEIIRPENISPVYFDFNGFKLRKEGKILLDSVYDILYHNPTYTIKVDAHTDSKGSDEYNIKLSKRRADAVVNYLLKKGVESKRITREAFGKSLPAVEDMPNGVYDPAAAQKNRRALIHITKP
jgi:OOP family OmpA-OmpF porin